ncbi:hypothetical protein D3OALGA1CA_4396 [Olavius algarvensis associated proteobacterium Delta 3]|nr:hypothetical protein D3OALGA1CA_4396 [Olavius algarvensis associated proteobacterium Delta 3]CAB5162350.1 hypothetical protein D3OALGB2SA_5506 [Olavius algarvensis associated proteobacterium Delta 3]
MSIQTLLQDYDEAIKNENAKKEEISELQEDVQSHLEAVRQAIFDADKVINDLQVAKQRLETEAQNLDQRDNTAQQFADSYFDAINDVRAALSTGGELEGKLDTAKDDLQAALAIADADIDGWLTAMLAEVTQYDNDTQQVVDDASTNLNDSKQEYEVALTAFQAQSDQLRKIEKNLVNLVQKAKNQMRDAQGDVQFVSNSISENKAYEGVVFYFDLKERMDRLTSGVNLSSPDFDADNPDKTALTSALKTAWTVAKTQYSDALETLYNKHAIMVQRHGELAQAKIEKHRRISNRLEDAARLVEIKHDELKNP